GAAVVDGDVVVTGSSVVVVLDGGGAARRMVTTRVEGSRLPASAAPWPASSSTTETASPRLAIVPGALMSELSTASQPSLTTWPGQVPAAAASTRGSTRSGIWSERAITVLVRS